MPWGGCHPWTVAWEERCEVRSEGEERAGKQGQPVWPEAARVPVSRPVTCAGLHGTGAGAGLLVEAA